MWFTSTGLLEFNQRTLAGKRSNRSWYASLVCSGDLQSYYCWLAARSGILLERPAFGAHVSIIKEQPRRNIEDWDAIKCRTIQFQYSNDILTDGEYWWLSVRSQELDQLRNHFGLSCYHFHMTLGRSVWQTPEIAYSTTVDSVSRGWVRLKINGDGILFFVPASCFDSIPQTGQHISYMVSVNPDKTVNRKCY